MPSNNDLERFDTIIGDHRDIGFSPFVDDHMGLVVSFDAIYAFLHEKYFPRVIFGLVYLAEKKVRVFELSLEAVGFEGSKEGIRLSVKHREKIRD